VFKISTNGALATLYAFGTVYTNAAVPRLIPIDGGNPQAGLIQGSDGNFYGTTFAGGTNTNELAISYNGGEFNGYGTVFKINTNGVLTTLYDFDTISGDFVPLDGAYPKAALTQGSDGNFYGTTEGTEGDENAYGTVFKLSTNGVLTNLYSFSGYDGDDPEAGLVQGSDGNLYGTTSEGGIGWDDYEDYNTAFGTVFKINPNMPLGPLGLLEPPTSLCTFSNNPGAGPEAALMQGSEGNLYGTTSGFGPPYSGDGTVFKISTNLELTTLYSFTNINDGQKPVAGLVQGDDGSLYGTTVFGGTNNSGTVFKINSDGTGFTTLHTFSATSTNSAEINTNSDGVNPKAGLILVGNTLYGTTPSGGIYGAGTVFSLTLPGPQLDITVSGSNVWLSWPANATGFTLESATNLLPPVAWQTNSTAPIVLGGQNFITNPISGSQMFFRLSQ
jgi:uncharacterized repeat protein (TIGR03803 family)